MKKTKIFKAISAFVTLNFGTVIAQASTITIPGGTMKSLGEAPDASELSGFFSGFKTIGTAISGICAITALIYFVINLTKFSTSAGNDMQRARALKGLLFSGVSLALFGGNRSNGTKCGLSYWNLNNLATNVNANIGASQSYQ